jgi:hypothetical protein
MESKAKQSRRGSCYTLEQLHVDHRARFDVPLGLLQDDKAIGIAHGFKNARALVAGNFHDPIAVCIPRQNTALKLGAARYFFDR